MTTRMPPSPSDLEAAAEARAVLHTATAAPVVEVLGAVHAGLVAVPSDEPSLADALSGSADPGLLAVRRRTGL
jgi:hypothetical protein